MLDSLLLHGYGIFCLPRVLLSSVPVNRNLLELRSSKKSLVKPVVLSPFESSILLFTFYRHFLDIEKMGVSFGLRIQVERRMGVVYIRVCHQGGLDMVRERAKKLCKRVPKVKWQG